MRQIDERLPPFEMDRTLKVPEVRPSLPDCLARPAPRCREGSRIGDRREYLGPPIPDRSFLLGRQPLFAKGFGVPLVGVESADDADVCVNDVSLCRHPIVVPDEQCDDRELVQGSPAGEGARCMTGAKEREDLAHGQARPSMEPDEHFQLGVVDGRVAMLLSVEGFPGLVRCDPDRLESVEGGSPHVTQSSFERDTDPTMLLDRA